MRCAKHSLEHHCRLKAEATGTTPGQWVCTKCVTITPRLIEYGHLEFADGRATLPYRPIPRNTRAVILRCIRPRKSKPSPIMGVPASSEAKGSVAREQATLGPVGRKEEQPERSVRVEASVPKLVAPEHSEAKGSSSVSRSLQTPSPSPKREAVKASAPAPKKKPKAKAKKKAPEQPPMDSLW